eukprot:1811556-Rhodomonas_salina.3
MTRCDEKPGTDAAYSHSPPGTAWPVLTARMVLPPCASQFFMMCYTVYDMLPGCPLPPCALARACPVLATPCLVLTARIVLPGHIITALYGVGLCFFGGSFPSGTKNLTFAYALAKRCPFPYAKSATGLAYALRVLYVKSGTNPAYELRDIRY